MAGDRIAAGAAVRPPQPPRPLVGEVSVVQQPPGHCDEDQRPAGHDADDRRGGCWEIRWVAWALILLTPLLTLLNNYLAQYVLYRTVTPAQYDTLGSPDQILPALLPDQLSSRPLAYFNGGAGLSPFVLLGRRWPAVTGAGHDPHCGAARTEPAAHLRRSGAPRRRHTASPGRGPRSQHLSP